MENNSGETFSDKSSVADGWESFLSGLMNDLRHDDDIQQLLHSEIKQIRPTEHNTEQGSGSVSGLPLPFGEQGSVLHQANTAGTDAIAAVTGCQVPGHDDGIQRLQGQNLLQNKPTGHKTEQGSGSGLPGGNEATVGYIRIEEQGSGSGLPLTNTVETEATAAVPGRPGEKRKREINSAARSKNFRDKKKKEEDEMKERIQSLQEKNKELEKDLNESNRKVDDLHEKVRWLKETLDQYRKVNDELQIVTNKLSQTVVNLSCICKKKTKGLKPTRIS